MTAVQTGTQQEVAALLDRGVDVDGRAPDGSSALHYAAGAGRSDMVPLLVARGADVDARDARGRTPLLVAIAGGQSAVAHALLDAGADVSAADDAGNTPLHLAASVGEAGIASALLDRGADPDAVGQRGDTPLHVATRMRNDRVARSLLDRGADPDRANDAGETARELGLPPDRVLGAAAAPPPGFADLVEPTLFAIALGMLFVVLLVWILFALRQPDRNIFEEHLFKFWLAFTSVVLFGSFRDSGLIEIKGRGAASAGPNQVAEAAPGGPVDFDVQGLLGVFVVALFVLYLAPITAFLAKLPNWRPGGGGD